MGVINEIPKPMDWRVVNIAGNNAAALVNEQFSLLKGMIDDTQRSADTVLSQIGINVPDFGEIEFSPEFDPYAVSTVVEAFEEQIKLENVTLNMPAQQTISEPADPGAAPNVNLEMEEFNANLSFTDIAEPSDKFKYSEPGYESPLDDAMVERILSTLSLGGHALGAVIEDAIWTRAKDRIADEYEQTWQKTNERWAAAGWDIPTGSHDAALREVDNKRNRALEQINYEIMQEQARLALADYHKALESGLHLEGLHRDFFNKVQDRALQAAVEVVRQGMALYQTLVEYNRLKLEKYKTEASVYNIRQEIMLRNEMAKIELFKSEVEVFTAKWQGQKTKMDAYLATIQAETAKATAVIEKNKNKLQELSIKLEAHTSHQKNLIGLEEIKVRGHASNTAQAETMAKLEIAAQDSNIRNAIERIKMQQRQLEVSAQLYVQRLASLYSAFNISASLGDSESTSESLSHSYSHQDSVSASVTESYNN